MSTHAHENRGDAGGQAAARPQGLHEDPHEVTLVINGYPEAQGWADKISIQSITRQHLPAPLVMPNPATPKHKKKKLEDIYINWKRVAIPRLRISHAAHLLFIQGIAPSQFFLAASLVYMKDKKALPLNGPLLFIAGKLTPVYESEAYWEDLVVGQLIKSSSDKINVQQTFMAMSKYEAEKHRRRRT